MAEPGYNFTPGLANRFRTALNGQANQLGANATQALQILSLHLPDVIGGHAPAPDALLRGGTGITPDAAVRSMASGQSTAQPPAPPRPSPLSTPGPNQPPLSIASPAPTFDSTPSPAPAEAPAANVAAPTIDTGGGGGGAPNPFPTQTPEPGPAVQQPNTPGQTAFRFKGGDLPDTPQGPPPTPDFQNWMDTLFGSGFGSSIWQGGNYGNN